MNLKSSLPPLFVFTIIIFIALLVSIVSFKFLPSSTVEFLNPQSLSFFCINLFTYLFIFNIFLVFLSFKKEKKEETEEKSSINKNISKLESKRDWQSISEILEEKSYHSLLNEFKMHDLRTRPYMGADAIHGSVKKLFKFSKILNIYHKVYNIMMSIHDEKKDTDKLANFLKQLIVNLQTEQLTVSLKIIHEVLFKYFIFMLISLSFFAVIGFVINDYSILKVNSFVLFVICTVLFVSFIYFHLKKKVYTEFLLPTSYFSHYLNKIIFVTVAFLFSIALILTLKKLLLTSTGDFHHYANLAYTFGELLLPSSFESLLSSNNCEHDAFAILVYKLVFIFILSYVLFSSINFAIKKYDTMYFSNIKKTLMPPELATLSIKFLLLILFLSLIYGTFFNYIHVVNLEPLSDVNASLPPSASTESSRGEMSDYIPFSIFIAIIGGLLTMATKDLLENYFAGLSLQMDAPYEEHDRVKINNSEMLEVKHIGIRADTFYGIKSNAEIIIPHQNIIRETIVNYTLPTLDYREEISIHIPHVDTLSEKEHRSIPKRAEMLLLLAAYVNTGVKIPLLTGLDIEEEIKNFRLIADSYQDKQIVKERTHEQTQEKVVTYEEYESLVGQENNCIEKIWIKLKESSKTYEMEKTHHPLAKLFIHNLVETVESAITDTDETDGEDERKNIKKIKSIVASIILSLDDYQKQSTILHHHIDKNFAIRKYRMFREDYKPEDKNLLQNIANELVHINYYYFILADSLWKLKNLQNSLYRKREVDSTSLEILDVPRVTTEHIYSGEGKINYWKVTLNITLELAEQSDEIIHHINMYVDNLWNDFNLPKYYEVDVQGR